MSDALPHAADGLEHRLNQGGDPVVAALAGAVALNRWSDGPGQPVEDEPLEPGQYEPAHDPLQGKAMIMDTAVYDPNSLEGQMHQVLGIPAPMTLRPNF